MRIIFSIFILFAVLSQAALASEVQWRLSSQYISNLDAILAQAKSKIQYTQSFSGAKLPSNLFVAFPERIPFSGPKVYADFISFKAGNGYVIEVAHKPGCQMSKTCMAGSLMLQWRANPAIYYDRNNKLATTPVALHHGIQGFYTHGFPMADFWPAKIEWRYREVLYILTWYNQENKIAFVEMANSVIDQLYKR